MAFDLNQFRDLIIRVTNKQELCSFVSTNLLLGTAAQESAFGTYLVQCGGGPARGAFQMEVPVTEEDIWENYLSSRYYRRAAMVKICGVFSCLNNGALEWNLAYQICMARLYYRRIKESFPDPDDIEGLAKYWKKWWNTEKGKGTVTEFITNYNYYVLKKR